MIRDDILRLFPEIEWIEDESIKEGVINAWLLAVEKGRWDRIDDIPFTLLIETDKSIVEHTRSVARMARAILDVRDDLYGDVLIAGALVHDVAKLVEYERKGDKVVKSELGKRIRHPVYGVALALEAGLPESVAHIVGAHSVEGEKVQRTPEAIVVFHCDFTDFEIERAKMEK